MRSHRSLSVGSVIALALLARTADARAQSQTAESRWVVDVGVGTAPSINGNVNSGVIGQGWYFGKPMRAEQARELLAAPRDMIAPSLPNAATG